MELKSDVDTANFDDIEENPNEVESFPSPRAYVGNHLPFVGFSFSHKPDWIAKQPAEQPAQKPTGRPPSVSQNTAGARKSLSTDDSAGFGV